MEASSLNYTVYFEELNQKVKDVQHNPNARLQIQGTGEISFKAFMQAFANLAMENTLSFPHPERVISNKGKTVIWDTVFIDDAYTRLSYDYLSKLMEFDDIFLQDVKLKHKIITSSLPLENCPFYSGSGYALLGGSIYSWYSLLAVQSLRKVGSEKPVEIIIPNKHDLDEPLCEEVFPMYNARCVTFDEVYPKSVLKKLNAKGYQLKALAILASSFEKVLYLDSDVFAVENPDTLFESDLFHRYGMITWPDFWRRTTSPALYPNLGLEFSWNPVRFLNDYFTPNELLYQNGELKDPQERVNLHDLKGTLPDWSTEAGLLLVNKSTHFSALLLALYYNINGPAGYYPLLSQGGAGEGDKETWSLAAHVLDKPWWQVNNQPDKTYGTWVKDLNWIIDSCIVQVDPLEDFEGVLGLTWIQEYSRKEMIDRGGYVYNYDYSFGKQGYEYSKVMGAALGNGGIGSFSKDGAKFWKPMYDEKANMEHYAVPMLSKPRDMFYHLHSPKLDPWEYILDNLFTDMNNKPMRNFGTVWTRLGWDFEKWVWETVRENMCDSEKEIKSVNGLNAGQIKILRDAVKKLKCFKGRDYERVCHGGRSQLDKRIEWLERDGKSALKNSGKLPSGWKLDGTERSRILQLIENSWNEDT
ncbi:hypothetical protein PMKS-004012 [Pichia membranifaciens]|uniref:Alpha-1,2-mannosyltransferase n=1 Tax=Pichia membranifaciens TaxID=4926 RepID=A0A1Q2YLS1_9ASCO|nr:hypothetical protein PMKS-004012 [Pichia membranifaciens]